MGVCGIYSGNHQKYTGTDLPELGTALWTLMNVVGNGWKKMWYVKKNG